MVEKSCDHISVFVEIPNLEDVPHIVKGRDLETLIVASRETLKRNNKKCSKEEVLLLVRDFIDSEIIKDNYEEVLDELIKCDSVQIKLVGTRTCLPLPKGAQQSQNHKQCNESLRIMLMETQNSKIL